MGGRPTITEQEREAAFARLIDGELDRSYRVARLILRNDADAEDAIQDAVVSAWRHWRELREHDRFDAWFGRIVVNRCRDRLRKGRQSVRVDLSQWLESSDSSAVTNLEDRLDLGRAFETLNPDQRVAVVLRYWLDLTVDEIARRTRVPPGTVKSRLHHALDRLRTGLDGAEVTR